MSKQKVAIVVDNNQAVTQKIIAEINASKEYKSVEIFDFSELNTGEFRPFKLAKLIYKIENLDLSEFDKVISISEGFANGVITNLDTKHENICVGFAPWYFLMNASFFKIKFRLWINLAMDRAEENFAISNSLIEVVAKIRPDLAEVKLWEKVKYEKMPEQKFKEDFHVMLCGGMQSDFIQQVATIFNQTGRKIYLVGNQKLLAKNQFFSKFVEFIDEKKELEVRGKMAKAKGVIFDQYFNNLDYLARNLEFKVPVLSFRNNFIQEYFDNGVFTLKNIDSFENDFAKFISWSKIQSQKDLKRIKF